MFKPETEIYFKFKKIKIPILYEPNEKFKDVKKKFLEKTGLIEEYINFEIKQNPIKDGFTIYEIPLNKAGKMIVNIKLNDNAKKDIIITTEKIMCQKCHKILIFSFDDDYKISLNCNYCHNKKKIFLEDFEKIQKINLSKKICSECRIFNMGNFEAKHFYRCVDCKKDVCGICNIKHESHKTINYDDIYNYCEKHDLQYNSYCNNCKIDFRKKNPGRKKNDNNISDFSNPAKYNNKLKDHMIDLKKIKKIFEELKNEINEVFDKIYHIYEIIFNLNSKNKSLFEKSELNFRNYQDFIINRVEKDFSPIINSNNISDKFQNILIFKIN